MAQLSRDDLTGSPKALLQLAGIAPTLRARHPTEIGSVATGSLRRKPISRPEAGVELNQSSLKPLNTIALYDSSLQWFEACT
jgi:hypothetical protein